MSKEKKVASYKINEDGTITIKNNTYKRKTIKFIKIMMYFDSILFLLLTPVIPFTFLIALFFGFVGFKYSKILKSPIPTKPVIETLKFQSTIISDNYSDSEEINQVLNINLPKDKKARVKFFVTGTRHQNRDSLIKEFLHTNAHNIGRPFLNIPDSEIIELNRTVYEYYYDNLNGPIRLEPEPDNNFDKNAIKVIVDDKHVGYVPASDCERVHKFIESNEFDVWWQVRGGVSKFYPGYGNKVSIETDEPGIQIKLFKK